MKKKVQWGVLGVAEIGVKKVIPAMQRGEWSEVTAIGSRDLKRAQQAAKQLGIPKAYGSYEELWPIQKSKRSTIHSPTICMFPGRLRQQKPENMSFVKSRSV